MTEERIQRLNAIDFGWVGGAGKQVAKITKQLKGEEKMTWMV